MAKKEETGKAPAQEKVKKAPGFYKKALSGKQLEKKYLKYLEQPDDKAFIRSCYTEDGDVYRIRQDLGVKAVKRLGLLKKAIKANRKFAVNFVPLAAAAALVAAVAVFSAVFADPLLQRALEAGLEAVFEARVNADNFKVSLLKFEIGMDGLTIADRDQPMKNLIQFSRMGIKLKPAAVLRGKVYIEEIRADNIRFGTDRTVSGALPGKPPKEKPPKAEVEVPPLVNLQNFDPVALLNQEYGKLQTPKLYDSAVEAYNAAVTKWKAEEEAVRARLAELRTRAEPLLRINVNDYQTLDAGTIEQIRTLVGEVNALVGTVEAARGDVERIAGGVRQDWDTAVSLEQGAQNAIEADFNHLRSYLDLGGGAAMEVLEPVIRGILTGTAEQYLAYGQRALEVLEKVRAMQAKLPKSAPKPPAAEKYKGRDVVFPVRQYPGFFLGVLETDVLTPSEWLWDFDLRGVSSDPDLSGAPTSLALSLAEAGGGSGRSGSFKGEADFRSSATERFNAQLSGGGFPVDVSAGLEKVGVDGFSGGASFTLNLAGNTDGGFSGGGDISLAGAKLTNPANTFAQAADEAIRQVAAVNLGIQYEHAVSGDDRFSVSTNFGAILRDALARIVNQYRERAAAELERVFNEKIAQYIDGRFVSKEELTLVFDAIGGDQNAVEGLKSTLDQKKTELEGKIRAAAEQAVQQAADELKEQGKQAVEDVLQGQTPSFTPPSAPSLPNIPGLPNLPRR